MNIFKIAIPLLLLSISGCQQSKDQHGSFFEKVDEFHMEHEVPPDLQRLRQSFKRLPTIVDSLELELVDDPQWTEPSDTSYLTAQERADPDLMANVEASLATNRLIAWFGRDWEGFVGLWRGPHNIPLEQAPVVRLDSEGQYEIVAATIPDYLAGAAVMFDDDENSSEFTDARRELMDAGFTVAASVADIWKAVKDSQEPNDYHNRLCDEIRTRRRSPQS